MLYVILLGWILHALSAPAIIWLVYGVWATLVLLVNIVEFVQWMFRG